MAINAQTLAGIRNPMGGLAGVAGTFMKRQQQLSEAEDRKKQMDIATEELSLKKDVAKQQTEVADLQIKKAFLSLGTAQRKDAYMDANVVKSYITQFEVDSQSNPELLSNPEAFSNYVTQYAKNVGDPEVLSFLKTTSPDNYAQALKNSDTTISALEPFFSKKDKKFKPTIEIGQAINRKTKELSYAYAENGQPMVAVSPGKFRPLDPTRENFVGGDSTVDREQLMGLADKTNNLKLYPEDQKVLEQSDKDARAARGALPRINLSINLYKEGLIEGGALTTFMAKFKNYFKTVTGTDWTGGDDINAVFTSTATVKNALLSKLGMLPGSISNKDLEVAEESNAIDPNDPGKSALLNLKFIKMLGLRATDYNDEIRSHHAIQREKGIRPTNANFAKEFAKKLRRSPGVVSKSQTIDGKKKIQYLFRWEQKEKELLNAREELTAKIGHPLTQETIDRLDEAVSEKFSIGWTRKYGH